MTDLQHSNFKVIAHRGNSSQAPENTLASFQQAIHLNADYIECDLQLSKDLVPFVMHDNAIHRIVPNCKISDVSRLNWETLRTIDNGSWFDDKFNDQRILSLEEFLLMPKGKVGSMIEIKNDTFREEWMVKIAANMIKASSCNHGLSSPIIIGSLNPKINVWLQDHFQESSIIAIVEKKEDLESFLNKTSSNYYALHYPLAIPELIHFLRNKGKEVWAWTVDDKNKARKLIKEGIQGLITNDPLKMQQLRIEMKEIQS